MVLKKNDDGSFNELTRDWMNPNYLSYMQYWIFNYTNPTEIVNRGMNPDVREKGPYSYRWKKIAHQFKKLVTNVALTAYLIYSNAIAAFIVS